MTTKIIVNRPGKDDRFVMQRNDAPPLADILQDLYVAGLRFTAKLGDAADHLESIELSLSTQGSWLEDTDGLDSWLMITASAKLAVPSGEPVVVSMNASAHYRPGSTRCIAELDSFIDDDLMNHLIRNLSSKLNQRTDQLKDLDRELNGAYFRVITPTAS